MEKNTPEVTFLQTIKSSNLKDLSSDISELTIDQLTEDGLIRDIPIIGSIVKLAKTSLDIRNYLYLKKICKFLWQLKNILEQKRKKFVENLESGNDSYKRLGENILLIIDKLNNMAKPDMLGRIFKAHIEGKIDSDAFFSLCAAVDKLNVHDIPFLISFYTKNQTENYSPWGSQIQDLAMGGLANITPDGSINGGGFQYRPNKIGELFIEIALEKSI